MPLHKFIWKTEVNFAVECPFNGQKSYIKHWVVSNFFLICLSSQHWVKWLLVISVKRLQFNLLGLLVVTAESQNVLVNFIKNFNMFVQFSGPISNALCCTFLTNELFLNLHFKTCLLSDEKGIKYALNRYFDRFWICLAIKKKKKLLEGR